MEVQETSAKPKFLQKASDASVERRKVESKTKELVPFFAET
jgi:hypothetical protein